MLTLDISEKYLLPIIAGNKTFEIREKRDRKFYVGQYVCLKHTRSDFFNHTNVIISTMVIIKIKFITNYHQKPDYVVFSFDVIGDVMTEVEEIR